MEDHASFGRIERGALERAAGMATVAVEAGAETAAEHVRNALALIQARHDLYPTLKDGSPWGATLLPRDYDAVVSRLQRAVALCEGRAS